MLGVGYGQSGPYREAAGYDVVIEAEAGLMHMLARHFYILRLCVLLTAVAQAKLIAPHPKWEWLSQIS